MPSRPVPPRFSYRGTPARPVLDEDIELRVGTCGCSYPDGVSWFDRRGTSSGKMLERYARVFDTVEVNSTFYAIPPGDRVEPWERASPDGFRFGLEAPGR